jgi:hypothetical protein
MYPHRSIFYIIYRGEKMTAADFNVVDDMLAFLYNSGMNEVQSITVNHDTYALMMLHNTPDRHHYNPQTKEFFGATVVLDDEMPDHVIEFYAHAVTIRLKFKGR